MSNLKVVELEEVTMPPDDGKNPAKARVSSARRFSVIDLEQMGAWLTTRLLEKYPTQTPQRLRAFLRGCIDSPEYLFLRNNRAVALFQRITTPPAFTTVGHEIFVLGQEDCGTEAEWLYDDAKRWGEANGVERLIVNNLSDVALDKIRRRLPRMFQKTLIYARLGDDPNKA